MATQNRTNQITHLLKVLKKHFKPVKITSDRSVLEHLLFAACLENSAHEDAETAFAAVKAQFFDWNEVRVTTARELSLVMKQLNDADDSAQRLKRSLQSVFEEVYAFDLEHLIRGKPGEGDRHDRQVPWRDAVYGVVRNASRAQGPLHSG